MELCRVDFLRGSNIRYRHLVHQEEVNNVVVSALQCWAAT